MPAVADAPAEDRRGEGDAQPVPPGHRPDRLPHQQTVVGRRHRVERAHRDLELPRRVLGMELLHVHALRRERRQQVGGAVAQLDLPDGPVRRSGHRRDERVALRVAPAHDPLDLQGGLEGDAVALGGPGHGPAQDGAPARRMRCALLRDPVDRRPRPARLRGQHGQAAEVGVEAQIAVGGAEDVRGDDRVVGQEGVEDR